MASGDVDDVSSDVTGRTWHDVTRDRWPSFSASAERDTANTPAAGDRQDHVVGVRIPADRREAQRHDEEHDADRLERGGDAVRRVPVAIEVVAPADRLWVAVWLRHIVQTAARLNRSVQRQSGHERCMSTQDCKIQDSVQDCSSRPPARSLSGNAPGYLADERL